MPVHYAVHGSKISATTLQLLEDADVNASELDRYFDRCVARRSCTVIRSPKDPFLTKIRDRTGVPVEMIYRQRRTILIEIRRFDPFAHYLELSQNKCHLEIFGSFPEALAVNAKGKKLSDFSEGLNLFSDLKLEGIYNSGNRLTFKVKQVWQTVR